MRFLKKIRLRLQMLLHRGRESDRLDAELEFHLEQQIAENRAAGMGPLEARRAALRAFGNPVVLREEARESWSWSPLRHHERQHPEQANRREQQRQHRECKKQSRIEARTEGRLPQYLLHRRRLGFGLRWGRSASRS